MNRSMSSLGALAAATLVTTVLAAQSAAPRQRPARDAPPVPLIGTASISGVVTADDQSHRPLRHVVMQLSGSTPGSQRTAMTDDQGRFVISDLLAGRYRLRASKPAWVATYYGARQPGQVGGTPITLEEGQQVTANLAILPGAVATGTVFDDSGQPASGVRVAALQLRTVAGRQRLVMAGGIGQTSDDRGRYRLYGLAPGNYSLVASASPPGTAGVNGGVRQVTDAEVRWAEQRARSSGPLAAGGGSLAAPPHGPALGYAPVFYPNTVDSANAATITLRAGEERDGLDFRLQYVPVARVAGVVTGPNGRLPPTVQVNLVSDDRQALPLLLGGGLGFARPGPTGAFSFNSVRPGKYLVAARAAGRSGGPGRGRSGQAGRGMVQELLLNLWAMVNIDVNGEDITDLRLDLQPGMTISGRIVFEGTAPPPDVTSVRVSLGPVQNGGTALLVRPVQVNADATFALEGVTPGEYHLLANAPPGGSEVPSWMIKSAMAGGRDVLDSSLQVVGGQDISNVVITFTDKVTVISGTLFDAAGKPAPDFSVLVFTTDRSVWGQSSRRIKLVRPGSDGKFRVVGLPPGEYYLAALTDPQADIQDPSLLDEIVPASYKFTLAEGEKKVQDLKLAGGGGARP